MVPGIIPLAAKVVTDIGIGSLVHHGISNIMYPHVLSIPHKLCIGAGEMALTGVLCNKANEYVDDTIDSIAEFIVDRNLDKKVIRGGKK